MSQSLAEDLSCRLHVHFKRDFKGRGRGGDSTVQQTGILRIGFDWGAVKAFSARN